MNENIPPIKKVVNIFRLSKLINNDRFIRYSILLLFIVVIVVIILLAQGLNNPKKIINDSPALSTSQSTLPSIGKGDAISTVEGSILVTPTASLPPSAYSRALLSLDALNSIREIWSTKTTPINNKIQKEYNLVDTAGISFVSKSGDYRLSIEIYRFVNDAEMAQKVSQELKDIYLQQMRYENTSMACPVVVNEPSWILFNESHKSFLLGKAIPNNFINIRISSDGYIDTDEAVGLMCQIVEKQVNGLKDGGY